VADWVTISALATAGGTLVLAGTTYASVRSANRAARVAEASLLAGLRPLLVPSSDDDPPVHAPFAEGLSLAVPGGGAAVAFADGRLFLAVSLRNVGPGIGVLHGGYVGPVQRGENAQPVPLDSIRRLVRDLYIPPGELGYWQGRFRDDDERWDEVCALVEAGRLMVDVLYGDYEGGQRVITRMGVSRREETWTATVVRHWQIDRSNPR
jgi:hypothetical protein